jgi:NADPH2 dehydrogenase
MELNRFSKLIFKTGQQLRNRVVVPPMASETASTEGFVTEATLAHYSRLTESNAGLVMVEYSHVHLSGRSEPNQLGIDCDDQIAGLSEIARLIHQRGSLAGIQLVHAGGKTSRDLTDGSLMSPSAIIVPVKDQTLEAGDEMSLDEIRFWKKSFLEAAVRAAKAGFDLVELHAAHGYGLNQWLSPITNQRTDEYGGTRFKRAKILLEIVEEIKFTLPDLLIAVRMPGQDFLPGGLTIDDTQVLAQELERLGVDILDISSGIGGWRRPRERTGQGYLTEEAAKIQAVVSIPVIGVGGIEHGSFIDEAIQNHTFSLAAVGRAILKAPLQWAEQNLKENHAH